MQHQTKYKIIKFNKHMNKILFMNIVLLLNFFFMVGCDDNESIVKPVNKNWENTNCPITRGFTLYSAESTIFAGGDSGAYKTTDNGNNWISINNGLEKPNVVYCFSFSNSLLWCASEKGLYYSTNFGDIWNREKNSQLTNVRAVASSGGYVFAYDDNTNFVYYTTNLGLNWIIMNQGFPLPVYTCSFAVNNNNIYAATKLYGTFHSVFGSTSWTQINGDLPIPATHLHDIVYANEKLYIAGYKGIWYSSNNGQNWLDLSPNIQNRDLYSLHITNSNIFIGTEDCNIIFSSDYGNNWVNISNGLPNQYSFEIYKLSSDSMYVFGITSGAGIYRYGKK